MGNICPGGAVQSMRTNLRNQPAIEQVQVESPKINLEKISEI